MPLKILHFILHIDGYIWHIIEKTKKEARKQKSVNWIYGD